MTADERLAGIQLKIKRAETHIGDLNDEIATFLNSNPYEFSTKRDPETRALIYYMSKVDRTPDRLATIFGDIIQNLRSSLDQLAYQLFLIGTDGVVDGKHVYFPISLNAQKYETQSPGKLKGMRKDAKDALAAIEPYANGKGHELWMLHELNIIDKHRLIISVGSAFASINLMSFTMARFEKILGRQFPAPQNELFFNAADNLFPLKVGDEIMRDAPDAELNQNAKFTFNVALNEPGVIEGKPLLETAEHFRWLVSNTVAAFRPCLA